MGSTSTPVQKFIARARELLRLPEGAVAFHAEGASVTISILGELPGERPLYAWRRRRSWMSVIRSIARRSGIEVGFDFSKTNDALSALERSVRLSILSALRGIEPTVSIEYSKIGHARAIVSLGEHRFSSEQRKALETAARDALVSNGQRRIDRVVIADGGLDEATDPQILRLLRVHGPVRKEALEELLREQDLKVPSIAWLERALDRLRRNQLIRYLGSGLFAVSANALLRMPSRTGRVSADVQRSLVLARRRTW